MDRLVKYAHDKKTAIHLFLIPTRRYVQPERMRTTPAMEKAGVI